MDAFVAAHRTSWERLEHLVKHRRELSGPEVDELVELYQRTATHLSIVRSTGHDPVLMGNLSALIARARSAVTGAHTPAWREIARFFILSFPVVAYRARRWWLATGVAFVAVSAVMGFWVAGDPQVQAAVATPDEIRQLVEHDFADYYSENPAGSFSFQVWVNNSLVSGQVIAMAVLLGIPIPWVLWQNAANVGLIGGLMADRGKADIFFGLILPHGLLELTAVFLAAAVGMRLGWTVIDPGPRRRVDALAEQGRAVMSVALGLVVVLLISGAIEGLVTPSPLPTWARVTIGVVAEIAFIAYIVILGRRAERRGETGDMAQTPDLAPTSG